VRDGRQSPVSVKSRISEFSGYGGPKSVASGSARNSFGSHLAQSPSNNGRIRQSSKGYTRASGGYATTGQQGVLRPPESIEAAACNTLLHQTVTTTEDRNDRDANMSTISMDESHGLGHTSHSRVLSDSFGRAEKGGVASSFLAAIASSSKSPGVPNSVHERRDASNKRVPVEIRPAEHADADADRSIAASSVSGDDFAGASKPGTPSRKPRLSGSVSSFAQCYDGSTRNAHGNHSPGLTLAAISRLIEEQLEAKFAVMNEALGAEIRRVEEQTKTRLDELEKKVDSMVKQASIDVTEQQAQQTAPLAKPSPAIRRGYYRSQAK
jgi:hypothetical protein